MAKLRAVGIRVEPSPELGGRGHASLVNLNAQEYGQRPNTVRELAERIANELVDSVEGPLGPFRVLQI